MTLTKRFLCGVGVKTSLALFQERLQREEVEAESITNSSEEFCWKDDKGMILEENVGLREGFQVLFC